MTSQNIQGRVVGNVLNNISPSNNFLLLRLPVISQQNCQTAFGSCEHSWVTEELIKGTSKATSGSTPTYMPLAAELNEDKNIPLGCALCFF